MLWTRRAEARLTKDFGPGGSSSMTSSLPLVRSGSGCLKFIPRPIRILRRSTPIATFKTGCNIQLRVLLLNALVLGTSFEGPCFELDSHHGSPPKQSVANGNSFYVGSWQHFPEGFWSSMLASILDDPTAKRQIQLAMDDWSQTTCIKFKRRTSETAYVSMFRGSG